MLVVVCQRCGKEMSAFPSALKNGRGKYCSRSCNGRMAAVTHGESRTRLHNLWVSMRSRCRPGSHAAAYYHDRGIGVCPEWDESYEAFRDWALASGYADGLELDRIDNDRGYEPGNCRWATRNQQMANQRKRRDARTSRYRGVSWCSNAGKWRTQVQWHGVHRHVGLFTDEVEAAKAYDREARLVFGEFASLNFKEQGGATF